MVNAAVISASDPGTVSENVWIGYGIGNNIGIDPEANFQNDYLRNNEYLVKHLVMQSDLLYLFFFVIVNLLEFYSLLFVASLQDSESCSNDRASSHKPHLIIFIILGVSPLDSKRCPLAENKSLAIKRPLLLACKIALTTARSSPPFSVINGCFLVIKGKRWSLAHCRVSLSYLPYTGRTKTRPQVHFHSLCPSSYIIDQILS